MNRTLLVLSAGVLALGQAACNPNPFCLNCDDKVDLSQTVFDFATAPVDLAGTETDLQPDDGGCIRTNMGVETCDHIDNDCNGTVDDVDPAKLAVDPNNCGVCFNVCDYSGLNEYGACSGGGDAGAPHCLPSGCIPGYFDVDKDPKNGCEYACVKTMPPTEVCDGKDNDCNGIVDDGFGYPNYALDTMNCGACGSICNLPGAVSACVPDGMTQKGLCIVDHCINDGKNTFRHPGYMQGLQNTTGCEYHCARPSHTMTMGSMDCDNSACLFDAEICNGIDDDCDFLVDDKPVDVGGPCGGACPNGDVKKCVGECKAGTFVCQTGVKSCQGSLGPNAETCDGKDNDCNGTVDDNLTDPWLNQACCPSGNIADCGNTKTGNVMGTRCMAGAYSCTAGMRACLGGVMKTPETCNGIDDNCNGLVDDVPGINAACSSNGVNTVGACTADYLCVNGMAGSGPLGLTCSQQVGPMPEVCNGIDDDCDGVVDNNPSDVGKACGSACPGGLVKNCIGACLPGTTSCVKGGPVCGGSVGPTAEICDGIDNDCNGIVDDVVGIGGACSGNGILTAGACTAKYICNGKKGLGPLGLTCQQVIGPMPEVCNAIDDDCNGVVDDNVKGAGATCADACPGGKLANCVGQCKSGVAVCMGGVLSCSGSVGPSPETCNGKDDDCNGVTDDNLTETWAGQACCPTGNNADCGNTGGGTFCSLGKFVCTNAAKVCSGGVSKSPETCNGKDDDCNGLVDDVPGIGLACMGGGIKTLGACSAGYICTGMAGGGPNGLTCNQTVGPKPETCNGIDDDCDGVVDNNLTDVGAACGASCPGGNLANCVGQCKAGVTACQNGAKVCSGSTGPAPEVCNAKDDDCNGIVDDNLTDAWIAQTCCPTGNLTDCQNTGGGKRCMAGSFQCAAGARVCQGGVVKSAEICNSVDDDCNGLVDDIAGIGSPCAGGGVKTLGACTASYVCTGNPGMGPSGLTCKQGIGPMAETCNGVDDDCDGVVDDNLTDVGAACGQNCPGQAVANCIGQCKAGAITCSSGVKVCTGSTGPTAEVCDGVDNDCNGTIDDGYGYPLYNTDVANCGKCAGACGLANAINGCHSDASIDASNKGVCYVVACNNTNNNGYNYVPTLGTCGGNAPPRDGPSGIGCNYACPVWPSTSEACDGKDNNCNGVVDEPKSGCAPDGLTQPANFCATLGVCMNQAIPIVCGGAGGWKCNYSGVPGIELDMNGNLPLTEKLCDAKDGNCNGVIDLDGFPNLTKACTVGVGVCQGSGTIVCLTQSTSGCNAAANAGAAVNEVCDGKDNNCNGLVDERTNYTDPMTMKTTLGWRDPMVATPKNGGGSIWVYEYEATHPDATNNVGGSNTTRACGNVAVLPWAFVTETQAQAACAAIKDSANVSMRLCTAAEWQTACEGPGGTAPSKWSQSATPTANVLQVCNDVNESMTPAMWATGTTGAQAVAKGTYCYTDWVAAGKLYDFSGNLAEWTSSTVVSGGTTYYQILGGSYNSPAGGTTCEFSFDIAKPGFANTDLGFRCCADNAP